MVERSFFGQLFGLLGHGGQFVEEDLGVESSRDSCPKLGDGGSNHLALLLLEELPQGPSPVQPLGMDRDLLAVIGRDDVVHGPDVTAGVDPYSLAG